MSLEGSAPAKRSYLARDYQQLLGVVHFETRQRCDRFNPVGAYKTVKAVFVYKERMTARQAHHVLIPERHRLYGAWYPWSTENFGCHFAESHGQRSSSIGDGTGSGLCFVDDQNIG